MLWVVGQELTFARLATNMLGRSLISEPSPPSMSMLAQFMYISRFPTELNHVQPSVAAPDFIPVGIVKLKELTQSTPLVLGSEQESAPE